MRWGGDTQLSTGESVIYSYVQAESPDGPISKCINGTAIIYCPSEFKKEVDGLEISSWYYLNIEGEEVNIGIGAESIWGI